MWIRHKSSGSETLAQIAAQYKLKDPKVLASHDKNRAIAPWLKKKEPLPKGTVVWVPDPRVTCYVVPGSGGKVVLEADKWKKLTTMLDKRMDELGKALRRQFDMAEARHDAQDAVNEEFPIVSLMSSKWFGNSVGREPVPQFRKAKAAIERLESTVAARRYKQFEADAKNAEDAINAYRAAIGAWVKQLTGSAENWVTGLSFTRDASFTIFGAAAMTVAAPATLGATFAMGAGVGAGTGFMSSAAGELGKGIAGDKMTAVQSTKNIASAMAKGALFGSMGAGASRFVGKFVVGKLTEKIMNMSVSYRYAVRFVMGSRLGKDLGNRIVQQELNALIKAGKIALPPGTDWARVLAPQQVSKICVDVISKFITRLSVGSVSKVLVHVFTSGSRRPAEDYLKANALKMTGKANETALGDKMAKALERDPLMEQAYRLLVEQNLSAIQDEICVAIRPELEKAARKQPAGAR